jgi:hypothetical protein
VLHRLNERIDGLQLHSSADNMPADKRKKSMESDSGKIGYKVSSIHFIVSILLYALPFIR